MSSFIFSSLLPVILAHYHIFIHLSPLIPPHYPGLICSDCSYLMAFSSVLVVYRAFLPVLTAIRGY